MAYPRRNIQDQKYSGPQQFADLVRGADGLIFLSHLEERMDWDIDGITGNEIYNTHADFKEEQRFITALRSPLTLLGLASAVRQFPQEMFAALQDYPADYLKRWDQLCQKSRHTGVSANDAHHNQAYRARLTDDGKVLMHDALDKKLAELDPEKIPLLKPLTSGKKPGDVIFEIDLDPYERSFRHVSTHLLLPEITEASIWDALKEGRAYVAFDWMADPTGFVFRRQSRRRHLANGCRSARPRRRAAGAPRPRWRDISSSCAMEWQSSSKTATRSMCRSKRQETTGSKSG